MKGGSPLTPRLSRLLCDAGLVNSGEELVPVARNHPRTAGFLLSLASLIQSHGHRCFPFLLLVLSAGPRNMETRKQRLCHSPGGPAATTLCFHCSGHGFHPWLGN